MTTARPSGVSRVLGLPGVRLFLWCAVASVLLAGALTPATRMGTYHDEHYFVMHEEVARRTLLEFGEMPQWDPYFCGGVPGVANPQDGSLSPDFLLRLAFGTLAGRHLAALLFVLLGMEGAYQYARAKGASALGATFSGVAWVSGGMALRFLALGWVNFFTFFLMPLVLALFERAWRDWRWAVAAGGVLAWMILAAGTYSVPYTVLLLGACATLEASLRVCTARGAGRRSAVLAPLRALAVTGVTAALLSAPKLLPLVAVLAQLPRVWLPSDAVSGATLVTDLLDVGAPYRVGAPVLALAALGVVLGPRRSVGRVLFVGLCFALLAVGDHGPLSPYALVRRLPLYSQLRDPQRFLVGVVLCASVLAGLAISALEVAPRRLLARLRFFHRRRVLAPLRLGAGAFVVAVAGVASLVAAKGVADNRVPESLYSVDLPERVERPFRQALGNRWDAQVWPWLDRGSLRCFEETPFSESPMLRGDLGDEEYPQEPAYAAVERVSWSPNRIELRVHATRPTRIVVNQNFAPQWSSSAGDVESVGGLLTTWAPAGDSVVVLRYRDGLFLLGLAVAATSLLGAAALVFVGRRSKEGGIR